MDRISWAFPYVPPGLFTQLVFSRSRELQATLEPVEWSIGARFSLLHRPPMGRVTPQPQTPGAASTSSAAAPATAPAGDPQDQEAPASPEGVVGTAPSAESTDQEFGEASMQEPPLTPRVASGISSSQPTFTPPGSETAGAEEFDDLRQEEPVAEPTAVELPLPLETSTLGAHNDETPLIEAELQTGTAASRGEVSLTQDDSLGPHNAEEPSFDAFSLLGPPKIEPTTKEEVEEEVYADPSTSSVGLPPLHTHHHPTQFESLATDPVFDEADPQRLTSVATSLTSTLTKKRNPPPRRRSKRWTWEAKKPRPARRHRKLLQRPSILNPSVRAERGEARSTNLSKPTKSMRSLVTS